MSKILHVALIGAGTVAQAVHLPVLRRRWDRFELTALVDISERRRTESSEVWGVPEEKRYASVADLVTAIRAKTVTVDAAVIASDGLHVEDVLTLIRRGIPVLAEAPLAYSEEEMQALLDFERMTGRQMVMLAHPQQYDEAIERLADMISLRDLRMLDYEVVMPASQPLYGHAKVTAAAYDLPTEVRAERRTSMQSAVEAGTGAGATQRDRDLYVKGLLTGVAHQLAVVRRLYGPITEVTAVRHWPKSVIPGSLELLADVGEKGKVRLVWHYLPFAPEYTERLEVLSARKRADAELAAPSLAEQRSEVTVREKTGGAIVRTLTEASMGSAESMWLAFHAFVRKGEEPVSGIAEAVEDTLLLRSVLSAVIEADGRQLDPEPEVEPEPAMEPEGESEGDAVATPPAVAELEPETAPARGEEPPAITSLPSEEALLASAETESAPETRPELQPEAEQVDTLPEAAPQERGERTEPPTQEQAAAAGIARAAADDVLRTPQAPEQSPSEQPAEGQSATGSTAAEPTVIEDPAAAVDDDDVWGAASSPR